MVGLVPKRKPQPVVLLSLEEKSSAEEKSLASLRKQFPHATPKTLRKKLAGKFKNSKRGQKPKVSDFRSLNSYRNKTVRLDRIGPRVDPVFYQVDEKGTVRRTQEPMPKPLFSRPGFSVHTRKQ